MNTIVAQNVRTFRELKHWTQHHLADTAGILLRTVQRVEKGDGASIETLSALSNALDLPIDVLQTDFSEVVARVEREHRELEKTHSLVEVTPVTCTADLDVIGGSDASLMECVSNDDSLLDAFAELKSNLTDIIDIWEDVEPLNQRQMIKSAFEQVETLRRLGLVVSVGKAKRIVRTAAGPLELRTLYVVAWPKGQERPAIAVEK